MAGAARAERPATARHRQTPGALPRPASARGRLLPAVALAAVLGGCGGDGFDLDLRDRLGADMDTSRAAQGVVADRPQPDARGVLSYPGYQVALAQRGDTVADVAGRVGIPAEELARHNGAPLDIALRPGEVLALPRRVAEVRDAPRPVRSAAAAAPVATGTRTPAPSAGAVSTATLDPAPPAAQPEAIAAAPAPAAAAAAPVSDASGPEPIRHKVSRGETAFTVARLYDVPPRALGEWNGLGADLAVREGQYLLIPVVDRAPPTEVAAPPGAGTATPLPPSAARPLPQEVAAPGPAKETPASPDLAATATGGGRFALPADGPVIRAYSKGRNDGIDIGATAGGAVRAADDGTVAAITRDTEQVPILVLRHGGNLLTVYAGVADISVEKGQTVKRGQRIASVRAGSPAALHFEVRDGFDSVDPVPYLE